MSRRRLDAVGIVAVAKEVGISLRQLYYWIRVIRIVRPRSRAYGTRRFLRFTRAERATLKTVKQLLDRGYTLRAAARLAASRRVLTANGHTS